jgi:hypothetical protein
MSPKIVLLFIIALIFITTCESAALKSIEDIIDLRRPGGGGSGGGGSINVPNSSNQSLAINLLLCTLLALIAKLL